MSRAIFPAERHWGLENINHSFDIELNGSFRVHLLIEVSVTSSVPLRDDAFCHQCYIDDVTICKGSYCF